MDPPVFLPGQHEKISCAGQLVVAYVMKEEGLSRDAALQSVQEARDCASPNPGFMVQLKQWEGMGCELRVHPLLPAMIHALVTWDSGSS